MDLPSVISDNYEILYDYTIKAFLLSSLVICILNPTYVLIKKDWVLHTATIFDIAGLLFGIALRLLYDIPFYATFLAVHLLMMMFVIVGYCCYTYNEAQRKAASYGNNLSDFSYKCELGEA